MACAAWHVRHGMCGMACVDGMCGMACVAWHVRHGVSCVACVAWHVRHAMSCVARAAWHVRYCMAWHDMACVARAAWHGISHGMADVDEGGVHLVHPQPWTEFLSVKQVRWEGG